VAIKQLSNKIELSFWHLTINLLTDSSIFQQSIKWGYSYVQGPENWEKIKQKIFWAILGTSIGVSIVIIGAISYLFFGLLDEAPPKLNSPPSVPANGQRNILVIGVDDLEKQNPRLASIWLLIYFPEKPDITFVPIFPDPIKSSISVNSNLVESFALNEDKSPNDDFVEQLNQKQLWWHGYVVIDSYTVDEVVNFFNQLNEEENLENRSISRLSRLDEFPPEIVVQTDLLNQLCIQAATLTDGTDISRILNLVPTHFRTDMSMVSIIQDWHSLASSESELICEFPILRASTP
jgi:hypothetical protein